MTLLSIWADGLWLIPVLLFGAAIYSGYRAYKGSKSGSYVGRNSESSSINVPFYKTTAFKFGVAFLVAAIVVVIWVSREA